MWRHGSVVLELPITPGQGSAKSSGQRGRAYLFRTSFPSHGSAEFIGLLPCLILADICFNLGHTERLLPLGTNCVKPLALVISI